MNDITKEWIRKDKKGLVAEKLSYVVDGTKYIVDGKHIILRPTKQERKVAAVLSEKYGKTVEFVPQIMYPQGIQTPDYLIDGDRYDLKTLISGGKNVIYNMVSKKKTQSSNFIFDITNCPLTISEIEKQIIGVYSSTHTKFIEKIIIMKNREIIKIYDRN